LKRLEVGKFITSYWGDESQGGRRKYYKRSQQTEDLKAGILANLEAKKADLIINGLNESQAIQKAKDSITSIDFLIDGNKRVYYNQMKMEFVQLS